VVGAGLLELAGGAAGCDFGCIVLGGEGGDFPLSARASAGEGSISAASRGGSAGSLAAEDVPVTSVLPAADGSEGDLSRFISDFIDRQLHSSSRGQ
jgi:hypothetical protein